MDKKEKIKKIIQFILSVAAENDERTDRFLSPIHIIKYVYLADLEYAKFHGGETLTGVRWKFHHFGPWSYEVYSLIEPALGEIGAVQSQIQSKYSDDFIRWGLESCDQELINSIEKELDWIVLARVKEYVKRFGSDTESLLHFVYLTEPMLKAAPEDYLDFSFPCNNNTSDQEDEKHKIELKNQNKKKEIIKKLKALKPAFNKNLKERIKQEKIRKLLFPEKYNDIFQIGLEMLEKDAGEPIKEEKLTCEISDEIWKSKSRYDPDLS